VRARIIALGLVLVAGVSHAAPRVAGRVNDPFEPLNRAGFALQKTLDSFVVGPLGAIFHALTPGQIGKGVHHFLINLSEPVVVINDMLQLRPARATRAAARFVVNSTLGVGGLLDPAASVGIPHHLSSFGDTLGRYGVGPGPYLFIPMIGPSTVRDLFGNGVDATIDPIHFTRYNYRQPISLGVALAGGLDQWVQSSDALATLLSDAADPYATLRSTYLQNRQAEIEGKTSPPAVLPDLDEGAPALAPSGDQPAALQTLPDEENGKADKNVASPLDQRHGQGDLGPQAKQGPEQGVTGLLHPDAHGGDEGGAADSHHEALQADDRQGPDLDPGRPQSQPGTQGAGDPGGEVRSDRQ
jgi:phospholipid-binding lipoprotein MlaA